MPSFFRPSSSRWNTSRFSELPTLDAAGDEVHTDYRVLAGGLALLLSRCSERFVRRDLPASLEAYRTLKVQLKSGAPVALSAQLLMDLSHEIAQFSDHATREAARRCLARQVQAASKPDAFPLATQTVRPGTSLGVGWVAVREGCLSRSGWLRRQLVRRATDLPVAAGAPGTHAFL